MPIPLSSTQATSATTPRTEASTRPVSSDGTSALRQPGHPLLSPQSSPSAGVMPPHRVELAAYLVAREVTGRPIDDAGTLRRLSDGSDSMEATRKTLVHSNVEPFVIATQNESYYRGAVGQCIGHSMEPQLKPQDPGNQRTALIAALGHSLGAGGCDSFASVVAHEHVSKLQHGESLERVAATASTFHSWVHLHTPTQPDIALDPWAQGPAMLAEDRRITANYSQGHLRDPEKANSDLKHAVAMVSTPNLRSYAIDALAQAKAQGSEPKHLFSPTHFVNQTLPLEAGQILATYPMQAQHRIAIQVAENKLKVDHDAAVLAAPAIVATAQNLHRLWQYGSEHLASAPRPSEAPGPHTPGREEG